MAAACLIKRGHGRTLTDCTVIGNSAGSAAVAWTTWRRRADQFHFSTNTAEDGGGVANKPPPVDRDGHQHRLHGQHG